jgi:hypothetical protein
VDVAGVTRGSPPLYGMLAAGWTRERLVTLLEHPVEVQRDGR